MNHACSWADAYHSEISALVDPVPAVGSEREGYDREAGHQALRACEAGHGTFVLLLVEATPQSSYYCLGEGRCSSVAHPRPPIG